MTIGGLMIGGLGALLFVVLLNYVIQPQMSVETRDLYCVEGDRFNVWYHEDSPSRASYASLIATLEESVDELLNRLDVAPSALPSPIDVLVHDTAAQLQSSIVQRKSPMTTHTFYAVLDLFAGEDPYPRLAELVLAFGWGQCHSQLLYTGTIRVLAEPNRNFHAAVAAAPARVQRSVEDLIKLEAAGEFDSTLYQEFDSPFSASMALGSLEGIATFYKMFGGEGNLAPEESFATLQAASLVQYLIDCNGGLEALRSVWGPGFSESLIARIACGPLDDLTRSWLEAARAVGTVEEEYEYYRALYLFEAGELDAAYDLTRSWDKHDRTDESVLLMIRTALAVGAFERARSLIEEAEFVSAPVEDWAAVFDGWDLLEAEGIRILGRGSEEELARWRVQALEARDEVAAALGFSSAELPPRITVFVYESREACQSGRSVTPDVAAHQTAWHVVVGDDIVWALAETLPAYGYRINTASNLLRTGLATVITVDSDELVARGCELLVAGEWFPLWQLGLGAVSSRLLQIETGLMIQHLVDHHGLELIPDLWYATARLGRGMSIDSAILEYAGTTRREIEEQLLNSVLVCD
jgi:hypothetical protein